MNIQKVFAGLLLVSSLVLSGCTSLGDTAPSLNYKQPISIGIFTYPGYAPYYIAQEKGIFKKYGVDVKLEQLPLDSVFPALSSGQIQMLVGTSDMMPVMADAGIAVKQILATSWSDGADGLLTTTDIKSVVDLKGKKVYVTLGFPDHLFFRKLQEKAGVPRDQIELVNMDADSAGAAFVAGKVDVAWTWEPYLSKSKERKDGHVLVTSHDEPNLIGNDILAARTDLITNRRGDVKNVMRAYFEASEWWAANPDEGNAIAAKVFKLSPADFALAHSTVRQATLEYSISRFDKTKPWNLFEQATDASRIYFADGLIKTQPSAESVTDGSLVLELKK